MRLIPSKTILAAGFVLALAFIFSCSGGDDGGSRGPVKKEKISGVSQKGPFTRGSAITLSELSDKLVQTGRSFKEVIIDAKGSFEIKNVELESPYAMLQVNGYCRNEVSGRISTAPINLYAISDIREKSNVNVNILTHLEYYRVQKLVEEGKNLQDAKKQAQKEILAVFSIDGEFKDSEDMSIFGTNDGDAALLAISVLLQADLTEGQFTEMLTDFSTGFKETGAWDSETAKNAIADWAEKANLASIRNNILGWNLSSTVPDFEKFVNNYWYINYGLGVCDAGLQNSIKKSNRGVYFICKDNAWAEAKYMEAKCFESKSCLTFIDDRDNQTYYSVKIGKQTWMAENLNYNASGSKCGDGDGMSNANTPTCDTYGRLYDWATAMGIDAKYNHEEWGESDVKRRGVCPAGWHIPNDADWYVLMKFINPECTDWTCAGTGKKLKANSSLWNTYAGTNLWNTYVGTNDCAGTDEFGFAALPGGGSVEFSDFGRVGIAGFWWSASYYNYNIDYDYMTTYAYGWDIYLDQDAKHRAYRKSDALSVRCLKDGEL